MHEPYQINRSEISGAVCNERDRNNRQNRKVIPACPISDYTRTRTRAYLYLYEALSAEEGFGHHTINAVSIVISIHLDNLDKRGHTHTHTHTYGHTHIHARTHTHTTRTPHHTHAHTHTQTLHNTLDTALRLPHDTLTSYVVMVT